MATENMRCDGHRFRRALRTKMKAGEEKLGLKLEKKQ